MNLSQPTSINVSEVMHSPIVRHTKTNHSNHRRTYCLLITCDNTRGNLHSNIIIITTTTTATFVTANATDYLQYLPISSVCITSVCIDDTELTMRETERERERGRTTLITHLSPTPLTPDLITPHIFASRVLYLSPSTLCCAITAAIHPHPHPHTHTHTHNLTVVIVEFGATNPSSPHLTSPHLTSPYNFTTPSRGEWTASFTHKQPSQPPLQPGGFLPSPSPSSSHARPSDAQHPSDDRQASPITHLFMLPLRPTPTPSPQQTLHSSRVTFLPKTYKHRHHLKLPTSCSRRDCNTTTTTTTKNNNDNNNNSAGDPLTTVAVATAVSFYHYH
ncbi:hypothetical protein TcWFU_005988 [Taenia crassiceps]|uniref:Uncharacterized protein n=1 Tax=Taenia crassiceps TaxID=6207 RepID=A0ABR4Q826_9CEST